MDTMRGSTWAYSSIAHKFETRMEMTVSDKQSNNLKINYLIVYKLQESIL
jgi:hypothetical protein